MESDNVLRKRVSPLELSSLLNRLYGLYNSSQKGIRSSGFKSPFWERQKSLGKIGRESYQTFLGV